MREPQSILITGASSGIGEALAVAYARPGVRLVLSGRDEARLAAVDKSCRERGATVRADVLDVTDRPAMAQWIDAVDAEGPLDLVIANAGISAGTFDGGESPDQARAIFAVNLDGVLNTVQPAIPHLKRRRRGQIALMSSLASFRGFPGAPAYCASKAAVRVWGEALRGELSPHGIGVSVICPGFVVSRMTAGNRFPMPFLMEADRAAEIIRKGLARNRARIAFPWPMYAGSWLLALLPPALTDPFMPWLPKK
jgi:short-subunit dehydrogenase